MQYFEEYKQSLSQREEFWRTQAQKLPWRRFPQTILSQVGPYYRWFEDGFINMSEACLDHHVNQGKGEQTALIYDSPVTGVKGKYTYNQLLSRVEKFAGGLQNLGLQKGDTAIIYMPMIPEAVVAMLACARIGVIHSVVFGGFAAHELAIRIDDCEAKAIITATAGVEIDKIISYLPLVELALKECEHKPRHLIIKERADILRIDTEIENYHKFSDLEENGKAVAPVSLPSYHPLYILYTSGTTGKPKGIIRDTGGYATALYYSMKAVYDAQPNDTYWAASDVGWVVGHSYIVYAPLLYGISTILYEGKPVRTPDAGAFWRVVEEYQVNILFTAPTAFRAIRKEDPEAHLLQKYNTQSLRHLFLAGERCDPTTYEWAHDKLAVPVTDHWWQTETGWPIVANPKGLGEFTVKPGSATLPVPGYEIKILDPSGAETEALQEGIIAIKRPLPPGCLSGLWRNEDRFQKSYLDPYPGYYFTGDGGYKDEEGYVYIMGRVDDVINVAGHRLSTGEMEEIIAANTYVAECCVVGIHDELKGQVPMAFVVLKDGMNALDDLEDLLKKLIRQKIGAIASLKHAITVKRLPKTRSGKILRKTLRAMVDGEQYSIPSTIDDPSILSEIENLLHEKK